MVLNRHFLYGYCIWHFYAPAQEAAGKRDALAHDRCVLPPLCDSSRVCAGGCHAYKYTGATHPRAAALKLCESKLTVVRARRLYPCAFVLCLQHALSADSIVVGDISHANKLFGSLIHPQVLSRNAVCHTLRPKRCCSLPSPPVALVRLPENLAPTR